MNPILAILALTCTAIAAPVRVSWKIGPAQNGVRFLVVRMMDGSAPLPLGETTSPSLVVDALPGDKLAVVAFNELGEAPPSDPVEIPPAPSGRIYAVTIQACTDVATWQDVTILLPEEMTTNGQAGPRLFIRQKKP